MEKESYIYVIENAIEEDEDEEEMKMMMKTMINTRIQSRLHLSENLQLVNSSCRLSNL